MIYNHKKGAVFMSEYIVKKYGEKMKGAKVLELGCGPALVAILCAKMGASKVRKLILFFSNIIF